MDKIQSLIRHLPSCLHWSPDGEIRIVGRRIGLFHILKAYRVLGESPLTIAEEFELAPALIDEVLAFADRHRAEVDAYWAAYQAELDDQFAAYQPSPAVMRIGRLVAERENQASQPEA